MLNEFGKGAYILWRAYPRHRVFIDGRLSVYGRRILEDWCTLTWMHPGWPERLEHYGIDFILGDNRLHPRYYELPDWRLVYWDDVSRIMVKNLPQWRELIERFDCGLTCPDTFAATRLKRHGLLGQALAQLQAKVQADPDCLIARVNLASCYELESRWAEAVEQLRAAYAMEPNDAAVCAKLGQCLLRAGRAEQGRAYARRAAWLAR